MELEELGEPDWFAPDLPLFDDRLPETSRLVDAETPPWVDAYEV